MSRRRDRRTYLALCGAVLTLTAIAVAVAKKDIETAPAAGSTSDLAALPPIAVAGMQAAHIPRASMSDEGLPNQSAVTLSDLIPTEAETVVLFEAEELAIANCMNERGFEYLPGKYRSTEDLMPWAENPEVGSVESAQRSGYNLANEVGLADLPPLNDANADAMADLTPEQQRAWQLALHGSIVDPEALPSSQLSIEIPGYGSLAWDTNSCMASARRTVYGDDTRFMQAHIAEMELTNMIDAAAADDAEYKNALGEWSSCMKERGLEYVHPLQARLSLMQRYESGEFDLAGLQEIEIKVATTDAECHQQVSLGDAYLAAEQRATAELQSARQKQLVELAAQLRQSVERAAKLTESYASSPNSPNL